MEILRKHAFLEKRAKDQWKILCIWGHRQHLLRKNCSIFSCVWMKNAACGPWAWYPHFNLLLFNFTPHCITGFVFMVVTSRFLVLFMLICPVLIYIGSPLLNIELNMCGCFRFSILAFVWCIVKLLLLFVMKMVLRHDLTKIHLEFKDRQYNTFFAGIRNQVDATLFWYLE